MIKSFKVRIYPTQEQQILLEKSFGASRFIYNHFLKLKQYLYQEFNIKITYNHMSKMLDEILTYSEMYINFLKEIQSIKNIDDKLGQIKNVLDYERPCNQEDGFTLFKNKMIPILLFGFYKE